MWLILALGCARSPAPLAPPPDDLVYFAMVDRFADGDARTPGKVDRADPAAWHGGDLEGVRENLDHLESLGVRTLWLSPVFASRDAKLDGHGAFHGYWVTDPDRVEPRFGDLRDLRRLRRELARRDMRLVLDVVWNHVGYEAPLVKQRPTWFHGLGDVEDWSDAVERTSHDVHGLPDLAQEREPVYAWLQHHTRYWIDELQPDGFRVDAVRHMPLTFQARIAEDLRAVAGEDLWLVGEAFEGDPVKLAEVLSGGGYSAVFDFPLHYAMIDVFCKDRPVGRLASSLSLDRVYGDALVQNPGSLVTFLDNHDTARVLTACGGDTGRVRQALAFQLLVRGTPSLTWGTEIGLAGAGEPENRGDMRFDIDSPVRETLGQGVALRRQHPSLTSGVAMSWLHDGVLHHVRYAEQEAAHVAVNRGDQAVRFQLNEDLRTREGEVVSGFVVGPDGARREIDLPYETVPTLEVPARSLLVIFVPPTWRGSFAGVMDRLRSERVEREVVLEATAPLTQGETLLWVGADPELGAWSPERGVVVSPEGRASVRVPAGSVLAGKLVIRAADGSLRWEGGDDRYLYVSRVEGPLVVQAEWREP